MAQPPEREQAGASDSGASDFIAKLVKDPKNPPQVQRIVGYVGAAAEAGRTRIYLEAGLQTHVEVAADGVLHVEPLNVPGQPGLAAIWLAADAAVYPQAPAQTDARSYFGGAVYQDYLAQGPAAAAAAPELSPTVALACRETLLATCPTRVDYCTLLGRCTAYLGCPVTYAPPCMRVSVRCPPDQPMAAAAAPAQLPSIVHCPTFGACPSFGPCTHLPQFCFPHVSVNVPCRAAAQAVQPELVLQPSRLCTREAPYCTYICATTYPYTCPTHYYYCPTRTPACFYQQQVAMAAGGAMAQPMAAQAIHVTLNVLCHITHGGPECPVQTVEPNCVTQLRGCGLPAGGQTFAACTQVCGAGFPGQGYDPYAGYYGT